MNGFVSRLCDLDGVSVPAEMLEIKVDAQHIESEIEALSLRCAKESAVELAEAGDIVRCKADKESYPDGRTILIFTGTELPGAQEAAAAALGKRAGDVFTAQLAGKTAELCVESVIRRTPVEISDALIASLGIEGADSVESYRAYLTEKAEGEQKLERGKMIMRYLMDALVNGSEYSYDEGEMQDHVEKTKTEWPQPEGVTEEMVVESIVYQCKQMWVAEAFCRQQGIEVGQTEIEQMADQFAEMMQLMGEAVPERGELLEMARGELCLTPLFEHISRLIEQKFGG